MITENSKQITSQGSKLTWLLLSSPDDTATCFFARDHLTVFIPDYGNCQHPWIPYYWNFTVHIL
jgi:hypothetical protein